MIHPLCYVGMAGVFWNAPGDPRKLSLLNLEPHPLSGAELKDLAESYGGLCFRSEDEILLLFADYHWARRCHFPERL